MKNLKLLSNLFEIFSGFYEQSTRRRPAGSIQRPSEVEDIGTLYEDPGNELKNNQWRRILLLVIAITVSCLS